MGATEFTAYHGGADLAESFREAQDRADAEDGGRRGNVAAKGQVLALHATPVTLAEAYRMAEDFTARNARGVGDKWGPAGAIAVRGEERHIMVELVEKAGGFATLDEAAEYALAQKGLLREGESVQYGIQGMTNNDRRGRVISGQAFVPVAGGTGPEQTGWLFFGVAPE
jgi:hypothetical protein